MMLHKALYHRIIPAAIVSLFRHHFQLHSGLPLRTFPRGVNKTRFAVNNSRPRTLTSSKAFFVKAPCLRMRFDYTKE
ncbi:hypothetical protein BCR44DRAFT_1443493 [Catenaria anguillulae PL171]|uniref:Uncharacterized protein n=1 Tax=Catenaria anguillulae PL171 TaxID=765915 RepID=A0A1Y2H8K3_9FUNG|nr:hypothetical protein BCR44DRAFT_1443493 [Catenaria anguillulae PL171]